MPAPERALSHAILDLLVDRRRALHVSEIARELGTKDQSRVAAALDDLVYGGLVRQQSGRRFRIAAGGAQARRREIEAVIHVNPRGFAFLKQSDEREDVFVPAEAIGGAMHGDRVRARVIATTARGSEGEVVEVLARGRNRVVGTLRGRPGGWRLEPDDTRVRGPIPVVDEHPEARAGAAAVVQLVRYPERPSELPEAKLLAVLGEPGDPDVEVAKILIENGIDEDHPPAAVAEAEAFGDPNEPGSTEAAELSRREDLTRLPLVTIDPADARDHDDAVWVERGDDGGYTAWIAIADVSYFVREGSALDACALERGASVYLPDRAVPMLPPRLAAELCSLVPGADRLCLCVEVELDPTARVTATRVFEARMRSQAFLTYGGVARALGFTAEAERDPDAEALRTELGVMWELASELRKRRMRRGALDFDLPESLIVIDDATRAPIEVRQRAVDPGVRKAYRLVEELMLLANEAVARFMLGRSLPAIFRVHGAPDPDKLDRFATLCRQLGVAFEEEDAAEPKRLSKLLRKLEGHEKGRILHMLLLRAMQQAAYDVENIGHFGLASSAYLHFTSPIRRYPDLVVHRLLRAAIAGSPVQNEALEERLRTAAVTASERERLIMDAERSVADLYRALYMGAHVGELFEGQVTAITSGGIFVQLADPFVSVLVRYDDLGPDAYEPDEDMLRVTARRSGETVALGDAVTVEIVDTSVARRSVYGKRVLPEAPPRRRPGKKESKSGRSKSGGRKRGRR